MEIRNPLFREIHKNTWLKRVTNDHRKLSVGPKRERYWVVFCVHDDCEPLLEGYAEPQKASSHSPEWSVSLQSTLHISHALVPSENEYEFVVAQQNDTIRFHAHSWEIMQEWVDTLRQKLREMKILSPNENLYSKLPEVRPPLLPTRDPNSPLPATPPVPAALVPGVERIIRTTIASTSLASSQQSLTTEISTLSITTNAATATTTVTTTASVESTDTVTDQLQSRAQQLTPSTSMSNTLSMNLMKMLNDPVSAYSNQVNSIYADSESSESVSLQETETEELSSAFEASVSADPLSSVEIESAPSLAQTFTSNVLCRSNSPIASTSGISINAQKNRKFDSSASSKSSTPEPIVIPRSQMKQTESKTVSSDDNVSNGTDNGNDDTMSSTNITIINLSSPISKLVTSKCSTDQTSNEDFRSNVQIIPSNFNSSDSVQVSTTQVVTNQSDFPITSNSILVESNANIIENESKTTIPISTKNVESFGSVTNVPIVATNSSLTVATEKYYEQVFITTQAATVPSPIIISGTSDASSSPIMTPKYAFLHKQSPSQINILTNRVKEENSEPSEIAVPSTSAAARTSSTTISTNSESLANGHSNRMKTSRPMLTRGLTEAAITRRSRNENTSASTRFNHKNLRAVDSAQLQAARQENSKHRQRSSSTSDTQGLINRNQQHGNNNRINQSPNVNIMSNGEFRRAPNLQPKTERSLHASTRETLREQQVKQLRNEIEHKGGVRIQLPRKHCINSIALVDVFGETWIAGWKQKDHPMLYNAFHIGDLVVSVSGIVIKNANEAQKIIRNASSFYIEFIIRRIPLGKVFAIKREVDRQCLGLIRDGNTATIVDVVPNSLSARNGLPPKAVSCDGMTPTFWVLTEINGRPLNLYFKDDEVKDRLNAVGRDISILVQPSDLITKIRKQLKSIRGYKDYIVQ